jgi:DNA replication and repair protein RecF
MPLLAVQIEDLRCIRHAELQLDPLLTLISGPNAAGKTSILEAIFYLGRGRSFRTREIERLVRSGASGLTLIGHVAADLRPLILGIHASKEGTEARLAGRPVASLADLAIAFPVQVIDPNVHKLIEEGPSGRRRAMDWGVFHVEPAFAGDWQRYQRALKQRNAALRAQLPADAIRAWDTELASAGTSLSIARQQYVDALQPVLERLADFLADLDLSVTLTRGWSGEESLETAIANAWPQDIRVGTTTVGPHRADLRIRVSGFLARDRVSRGQQKLLAAALVLAQLELLKARSGRPSTLLLDDPAAELDKTRLQKLMHEVRQLGAQVIATSTVNTIEALGIPGARFHVEQGEVARML